MEIINNIINTTLNSFDFPFCIVVNILTYIVILLINDRNKSKDLTTWSKRKVMIIIVLITSIVYYFLGIELKLLINSAALAPVFWSWVMKPICKHFKVDYKDIDIFK